MLGHRTNRTWIARTSLTGRAGAMAFVAVAVVGAAFVLGALSQPPQAAAAVTRVGVLPDINYGPITDYGTGCSYTIEAFLTDAVTPVSLYDNGIPLATIAPTGGVALATWIPTTRGAHTISAVQGPGGPIAPSVTVDVGVGIPLGTSCLVL
ncbi:hypothetical protein [Nocardia sp. NPDC005366]|uniref:hypothetical protein n=1 Tax=Nocardia sp. NPDC005366 TaxID=3156878 RepID=UPI0033B681E5